MSWKGWVVLIIIVLIVMKDPAIITQVVNAIVTFFNAISNGLSNVNVGNPGGG